MPATTPELNAAIASGWNPTVAVGPSESKSAKAAIIPACVMPAATPALSRSVRLCGSASTPAAAMAPMKR